MEYSPKLKRIIRRLNEILEEEQVGGIIILHTPGFSEYMIKVETEDTCAKLNKTTGEVRVYNKHLSPSEKKRTATNTVNMFKHFTDVTGMIFLNSKNMMTVFKRKLNVRHFGKGFNDHRSQNN